MKFFFALLFVILFHPSAFAQLADLPVQWSFAAEKINEEEYNLVIIADIENGWSVYSQFLEDGGPIPTSFDFEPNQQIQFIGSTQEVGHKEERYDALFGMNLVKFSKKARFTQRVKILGDTSKVEGQLTFMTCDESSCLPPTNLDFVIALQ